MSTKPENPPAKTYAETKGAQPFDWNEFLALRIAGKPGQISDPAACCLAYQWTTCATGGASCQIPRDADGMPVDEELRDLGARFYGKIFILNWGAAKECLARIEARSAALLAEKGEK